MRHASGLIDFGFKFGLILAGLCLVAAGVYLGFFLSQANGGILDLMRSDRFEKLSEAEKRVLILGRVAMGRLSLLSCGIMVGISFGFLGFSLFSLGFTEPFGASGKGQQYELALQNVAPGVFVLLSSTVLIGMCATRATEVRDVDRIIGGASQAPVVAGAP